MSFTERATDPRLDVTPPQDPPAPVADAPVEPQVDQVDDPTPDEPVLETPPVEAPKPKKSAEEVLKGRVGHLTKTLSTKDQELTQRQQEIEDYKARLAAAEALLNSGGQTPPVTPQTPVAAPQTGAKTYSQADFEAAVAQEAAIKEFNRKADEIYDQGAAKFTDWKDSVDTLVAAGFMTRDLLDSAMAVDAPTDVLHYLGTNLDEAERISSLTTIKRTAEMTKLALTLSTPKKVPVSSAPAPITPVNGSANPQIDLQRVADTDDMKAYAAARAKQGSRWAQGRR